MVRDDALALYGFATEEERDLFLLLIGVQSVGPKMALAVLSGGSPRDLLGAVAAGDVARLQAVPGIGKRTAERIVVELREKVGGLAIDDPIVDHPRRRPALARARGPRRPRLLRPGGGGAARHGAAGQRRGPDRPRAAGLAPVSPIRTPGLEPQDFDRLEHLQTAHRRDDDDVEATLRPRRLDEFVGQEALKEQLGVAIRAAAERGEALDHVLLAGPPGLGKTSLAQIVAAELEVPFVQTAGPALERKGDIAAFLTALEPRSVFFVDEIHRLARAVEETFYPAMEDRQLPITVGAGAGARVVTLDLPPFTLVGATTRAGLLSQPLRDRFGIQQRLDHYEPGDLARIVAAFAHGCSASDIEPAGARAIAERSRGTPRVANRLLKRVRDFAEVHAGGTIDAAVAAAALELLEVDHEGLDRLDREILSIDLHPLRRRSGRALDARRRGPGGGRHDRGRLRALPAPARASCSARRAGAARRRTRSATSGSSRRPRRRGGAVLRCWSLGPCSTLYLSHGAPVHLPQLRSARSTATERTAGFRNQPRGCSKCGFGFLFELLDDYYPAPNAAFFVCDQKGRVIGCGRGSRELTGLSDEKVIGRPVDDVLGLDFEDGDDHVSHRARMGRAPARQAGRRPRRGRSARQGGRRPVPRVR